MNWAWGKLKVVGLTFQEEEGLRSGQGNLLLEVGKEVNLRGNDKVSEA